MSSLLRVLLVLFLVSPTLARAATWAVLDFESHVDEPSLSVLGPGVADMLRTDIVRSGSVQLVERDRLDAVLAELQLQAGGAVDEATAVSLGKLVGAEHIVLGAVHANQGTLRLDARLVDVASGLAVQAQSVEGSAEKLFDLQHTLARRLVGEEASDWNALRPEELTTGGSLLGLFASVWDDGTKVGGPVIERRPADPAPPPTKKVCKQVEIETDAIDGTVRKTARAGLMEVQTSPAGTVLWLRMPSVIGMKANEAISDPSMYQGGSVGVTLLLTDGTLVKLQSSGAPIASGAMGGGLRFTFDIGPEVVETFASSGPKLVRWHLTKGDLDLPVSAADAEKLWRPAFACFLQPG